MKRLATLILLGCSLAHAYGTAITPNVSAVKKGPIAVVSSAQSVKISWDDTANQHWQTIFSLDSTKPLITAISVDGRNIVELAKPYYRCTTGKRRGGWDAFFDFPPAAPQGTRQFLLEFHPATVTAQTVGDRVEVTFDGVRLGIFTGSLRYTFYPGIPLIQQAALVSTHEPDTAFYYDAGLEMTAEQDRRAGGNMESHISYYDVEGKLKEITPPYGSDRHSLTAHYRTVAAKMGAGSIAVFSPSAPLFLRPRLHDESGIPLVQLLAGQGWTGSAPVPRRRYDHRSMDERAAGFRSGNGPVSVAEREGLERSAQGSSCLHAQRSLCALEWFCNVCAALAPCLHRAGHGKRT